jgi:hypothetical protein
MSNFSRKKIHPFLTILIPIFFAYLGFLIGKQMVVAYYDGAFVKWAQLESAPAQISKIVSISYDPPGLAVETESGVVFYGDIELCQQGGGDCWTETVADDLVWESETVSGERCASIFASMEMPPQPVVQCATLTVEGADVFDELHLALLQDNSLWLWRFRGGALSVPFLNAGFLFAGFTFALGLTIGILIMLLMRNRELEIG